MTRRWITCGLAFALPVALQAGSPETEARLAQKGRFAATVEANIRALEELTTEDMTYTHASSKVETRQEFLDKLKAGAYQYRSIVPRDETARVYGDTVLLSGVADVDVVAEGKPLTLALRFLEVWVKQGGRWRLAAWQSTRVPEP
jgi:hypothetical protein